ncbi:MAG TPA: hypothetical protein PKE45_02900, partial [Caldilineaceae bacterium]|nr:hypothetical protein [Caldilineaceae bacterium]
MSKPQPRDPRVYPALVAGVGLACFVGLLYFPLLFTNRVLASGDILLYFYPYRDYAAATLRTGQLPLWNPYIFLGAPFLANPQAAVLYPLHWPLLWLPVTKQIYWSAAIHTWLFGFGGFLLMRRWGIGWWAAMVSALLLAGSGLYGGLIGHLNQMNVAAWLPWLLCWMTPVDGQGLLPRRPLTRLVGVAVLVALMVLAGHTQTAYISLVGLGVWLLWQSGAAWHQGTGRSTPALWHLSQPLLVLLAGASLGGVISAAQLLPTLELSRLGLRSGGLTYSEATSLSLKPLQLLWTLLPSYGLVEMEQVFATPAYSELIAYVGLIGLLLAVVGAWQGRGAPRQLGLLLAGLGLLLAPGRWNPLYFVLYTLVPGFDLFRTP